MWQKVGDVLFFEILGIPNVVLMAPEDVEVSKFDNFLGPTPGRENLPPPVFSEGLKGSTRFFFFNFGEINARNEPKMYSVVRQYLPRPKSEISLCSPELGSFVVTIKNIIFFR